MQPWEGRCRDGKSLTFCPHHDEVLAWKVITSPSATVRFSPYDVVPVQTFVRSVPKAIPLL